MSSLVPPTTERPCASPTLGAWPVGSFPLAPHRPLLLPGGGARGGSVARRVLERLVRWVPVGALGPLFALLTGWPITTSATGAGGVK